MTCLCQPTKEAPSNHTVVNGNFEWGLRRRSSVNVLARKLTTSSNRNGSLLMSGKESSLASVSEEQDARHLRVLLVDDSLLALKVCPQRGPI